MSRPSWDEMGIITALAWSMRSADTKHRVGACLMDQDSHRIAAVGYNGRAAGGEDGRESMEVGRSGCVHAEINCLLGARLNEARRYTLYCTHEPCDICAQAIVNSGVVARVVYLNPYHDPWRRERGLPRGSQILADLGVQVERHHPAHPQASGQGEHLIVTLEGQDNSGKSTLARHLESQLKGQGFEVLVTREPGSTEAAEGIRALMPLLREAGDEAVLLAMQSARCTTLKLEEGFLLDCSLKGRRGLIIKDRSLHSSRAYQAAVPWMDIVIRVKPPTPTRDRARHLLITCHGGYSNQEEPGGLDMTRDRQAVASRYRELDDVADLLIEAITSEEEAVRLASELIAEAAKDATGSSEETQGSGPTGQG